MGNPQYSCLHSTSEASDIANGAVRRLVCCCDFSSKNSFAIDFWIDLRSSSQSESSFSFLSRDDESLASARTGF